MKVISWNILSNLATKFTFAGQRLERPEEFQERYRYVIQELFDQMKAVTPPQAIALQEVTEDFVKQLTEALRKKNLPYQFYYPKLLFRQACLIHQDYKVQTIQHDLPEIYQWSKVQILQCYQKGGGHSYVIVNLHLTGKPKSSDERRDCLRAIFKLLQDRGIFDSVPIVMVGDFNEEASALFRDLETDLSSHGLEAYRKHQKITSYHAYEFHYDEKQRKLVFDGLSKNSEQIIDHLIYTNYLILKQVNLKPKNGLAGLQVPYQHKITKKEIIHEPNYKTWPSDHAMMVYEFV